MTWDIAALFRIPAREPASTMEQRVARLECRIVYLEELVDEAHGRISEAEVTLDGWRTAA